MATSGVVDNVLYFVASYFDKLARLELNSLIVEFYKKEELLASKLLLVSECDKIGVTDDITESKKKRLNTGSQNDIKQKISKDILDIWSIVDLHNGGQFLVSFVATDPPHLPSTTPTSSSSPSASPSVTPSDVNIVNGQLLAVLVELKGAFEKQQESIRWLTNISKHIYRHLDTIFGVQLGDSFSDLSLHSSLLFPPQASP